MTTAAHNWRRRVLEDAPPGKPETRIRSQIDGIEHLLDLKYRARVLDLGCGSGAQTLELARRRFRVVGMDVSSKSLSAAREQAKEDRLTVHFLAQDMRTLPYEGEFNAVVNVRNPIGCYKNEKDDKTCLEAAARALKTGGKLFLDLLNREWLIRRLTSSAGPTRQDFDIKTSRLDCSSFRPRGGVRADAVGATLRLYSLTEIIALVSEAGLIFRMVYGGYDGRPYGVESLRMIVVAEKIKKSQPVRKRGEDEFERALRIKGRPR